MGVEARAVTGREAHLPSLYERAREACRVARLEVLRSLHLAERMIVRREGVLRDPFERPDEWDPEPRRPAACPFCGGPPDCEQHQELIGL